LLQLEKKAEKDKRALGMEARLLKDPDTKAQWAAKIQEVELVEKNGVSGRGWCWFKRVQIESVFLHWISMKRTEEFKSRCAWPCRC
jgi:hypothetical protein